MTTAETIWIRPGDADYERLRSGYNEVHQATPALIAQVRSVGDVREALSYARSQALPVAVKGGGHSISGLSGVDGGVIVDVRSMSAIEPAQQAGEFWVGGGALAGDVSKQLGQHGLVVPLGDSAAVGICGLTLGGGIGWLTRKFGLTLDSLVAAEIVTADGSVSIVDSVEQPDLFWALRGGGGNFGVVTRLRFRPHRLGQELGGEMRLPLTERVLEDFLAYAAAAPNELGVIAIAMRPPDGSSESAVLLLRLVWSGAPSAGTSVVARLRDLADPISEDLRARSYHDMYELTAKDPAEHGALSGIEIRVLGGAMAVPVAETAFAHRDRKLVISAVRAGFPRQHYPANRAWVSAVRQRLRSVEAGRYLNFIEQPGPADVADVYPGETAVRLAAVKRAVDPENLFSRNLKLL